MCVIFISTENSNKNSAEKIMHFRLHRSKACNIILEDKKVNFKVSQKLLHLCEMCLDIGGHSFRQIS